MVLLNSFLHTPRPALEEVFPEAVLERGGDRRPRLGYLPQRPGGRPRTPAGSPEPARGAAHPARSLIPRPRTTRETPAIAAISPRFSFGPARWRQGRHFGQLQKAGRRGP